MRRIPWLLLVIGMIAGGCTTPPAVAPATQAPVSVPAATLPASPPTTGAASPAPARAVTAVIASVPTHEPITDTLPLPLSTAPSLSRAPGPPPAQTAPAVAPGTVVPGGAAAPGSAAQFTSERLGITLQYLPEQNGQNVGAQEAGDKVYVYPKNLPRPSDGQYVQVYRKDPGQSLEDAIRQQVLQGYSAQDCPVIKVQQPEPGITWPASYIFAGVSIPRTDADTPETLQAKARKCPQPYAALGGIAYFLADTQHPDKFAFLSIGQYGIMGPNGQPWQASLRFLDGAPTTGAGNPLNDNPLTSGGAPYLDDRSTPQSVLESYANALNRKEYLRAYAYWSTPAGSPGGPPPYAQFQQGFANTDKVQLQLGTVSGDVGAGQIYYSVPVVFSVDTTGGGHQAFAGCYILHLARPALQAVPPFHPLGIESAKVSQVLAGSDPQATLTMACQGSPRGGGAPEVAPTPTTPRDISAAVYTDDRSGPVQVLRSLFNAINRQEYARAYGYWEAPPGAGGPPPFPQFEQGYADTEAVQLIAGEPQSGVGAGQIYFQVPVTLHAKKTNGATQTFAGCYTLHISQPPVQGAPPFQPLAIANAKVQEVAANTDTTALMAQACQ